MVLILIGGVLGLLSASVSLTIVPFMAGMLGYGYGTMWRFEGIMDRFGMFGYPRFGHEIMAGIMLLWSLLGLVGALLSIYSGLGLRRKYANNIAFTGIIGGLLLLLTFSWLPSLLVLAGSVLAYFD
jgi:hypothetical protein